MLFFARGSTLVVCRKADPLMPRDNGRETPSVGRRYLPPLPVRFHQPRISLKAGLRKTCPPSFRGWLNYTAKIAPVSTLLRVFPRKNCVAGEQKNLDK